MIAYSIAVAAASSLTNRISVFTTSPPTTGVLFLALRQTSGCPLQDCEFDR
jgi:hypothetical protein